MALRLQFGPLQRLSHAREYEAVYAARLRKSRGPLTIYARPNMLAHHRLGLAIGRGAGLATRRTRLKRHLREAYRGAQHELARHPLGCYDLVIGSRSHDELPLARYRELLLELVAQIDREHRQRLSRAEGGG